MKKTDYDIKIIFWSIAGCNGMSSALVEKLKKNAFLAQKCTFDNFFHLISWFYCEIFVLALKLQQIHWPIPLPGFPMNQNIPFFGHFLTEVKKIFKLRLKINGERSHRFLFCSWETGRLSMRNNRVGGQTVLGSLGNGG